MKGAFPALLALAISACSSTTTNASPDAQAAGDGSSQTSVEFTPAGNGFYCCPCE